MNSDRKAAMAAGTLFIVGTVAGIISAGSAKGLLDSADSLLKIPQNEQRVLAGALFQFIMAAACSGIAVTMYPVLKRAKPALALGSVAFRLLEGALQILVVIGAVALIALGREYALSGDAAKGTINALGAVTRSSLAILNHVLILLTWSIGAFLYYVIFYVHMLIPRWLSAWGLAGVSLTAISSILVFFRLIEPMSSVQVVCNLPIGLQEMVLAFWLILKGFESSSLDSLKPVTPADVA
jgi:hypothetical protein